MKAVWRFLNKYIEQILLFVMISILICSVTLQVFTRIIGRSFSWTEEVARYSFVWLVMIGMSYATKNHLHIRMEVILALLHGKKRSCFEILLQMFALCICGYLFYLCLDYIQFSYMKKAPALNITMSRFECQRHCGDWIELRAHRSEYCNGSGEAVPTSGKN